MAALKSVWLVIDPSPATLTESEDDQLREVCFEEPIYQLPDYIMGSKPGTWRKEHTKVYLNEAEAKKDAEERLVKARKTERTAAIAEFDQILGRSR